MAKARTKRPAGPRNPWRPGPYVPPAAMPYAPAPPMPGVQSVQIAGVVRVEVLNWPAGIVGGSGGGGAGGGGGGLFGGSFGGNGFGRYLSAGFLLREMLRASDAFVQYQQNLSGATGPMERYRGEQQLQRHLFSLPIVGQIAELASAPNRVQTEQVIQQAEEQARYNALLEKSVDSQRRLSDQAASRGAGAPGSYGVREQDVQNDLRRETQRSKDAETAKYEEIDRQRELRRSQAEATANIEKAKYYAVTGLLPPGLSDLAASRLGLKKPDQLDADRTAREADAADLSQKAKAKADERYRQEEKQLQAEAAYRLKEIQYQKAQDTLRAKNEADVETVKTSRRFNVAETDSIYNAGRVSIESARHRGNTEAAEAERETTRQKLLQLQYRLQFGGDAFATDNLGAMDFGQGTKDGYIQGDPLRVDDILEALKEISTKLDELQKL